MTHYYNFGISQDDAATEARALELASGDRLLCIASAGEVPLNLLAQADLDIDAVDISLPQLHLAQLKLACALHLAPQDAALFIGYTPGTARRREQLFEQLTNHLPPQQVAFWKARRDIFKRGPVHKARFEQYIARYNGIALWLLNRKKLMRLFECDGPDQQREFFDAHLRTPLLRQIFNIAFHPWVYKDRGVDADGLRHSGTRNIAAFFFSKFRDFCTATPARCNGYLQLTFFDRILFQEAMPEYLREEGNALLRKRHSQLAFHHTSIATHLKSCSRGVYNRFALSNLGDWVSRGEYEGLLERIHAHTTGESTALARYIHVNHPVPKTLARAITVASESVAALEASDRYPFYSLVPMHLSNDGSP